MPAQSGNGEDGGGKGVDLAIPYNLTNYPPPFPCAAWRRPTLKPLSQLENGHYFTIDYNGRRPHQALADRAPMAVWRKAITGAKILDMLDNASALPTAAEADAASRYMIERNNKRSDFQLRTEIMRSRCARPFRTSDPSRFKN